MHTLSLSNGKQPLGSHNRFYATQRHSIYVWILMALCIGLSACGFQLRGTEVLANLPSKIVIIADNLPLQRAITSQLTAANVQVITTEKANEPQITQSGQTSATPTLLITDTISTKQTLLLNSQGNTSLWQLNVSTTLSVMHQQSTQTITLNEYQQVTIGSDINASNNEIETNAWQNLYQKLAQRIVQTLPQALP